MKEIHYLGTKKASVLKTPQCQQLAAHSLHQITCLAASAINNYCVYVNYYCNWPLYPFHRF